MINKTGDEKSLSFWTPRVQSWVSFDHFEVGCDNPILNLGYPVKTARRRLTRLLPVLQGVKRKSRFHMSETATFEFVTKSAVTETTTDNDAEKLLANETSPI